MIHRHLFNILLDVLLVKVKNEFAYILQSVALSLHKSFLSLVQKLQRRPINILCLHNSNLKERFKQLLEPFLMMKSALCETHELFLG